MTCAEACSLSKQLASNCSADHCLASCLYNDGVVQAVTFTYLDTLAHSVQVIIDIIIINVTDRCVLLLLYKLRFVSF